MSRSRLAEQQLDGDLALERAVGALGQPDFGHAARADRTHQAIGADAGALGPFGIRRQCRRDVRQRLEKGSGRDASPGGQHALELAEEAMPLRTQLPQVGRKPALVEPVDLLVEARQFLPVDDRIPDHGLGG